MGTAVEAPRNHMTAAVRAAVIAGTVVRIMRPLGRILPGLVGAAAVSVGLGQVAGSVFRHGLALWVGLVVGGCFALWFGAEINAGTAPPQRQDDTTSPEAW
jgi:hypothetical protein